MVNNIDKYPSTRSRVELSLDDESMYIIRSHMCNFLAHLTIFSHWPMAMLHMNMIFFLHGFPTDRRITPAAHCTVTVDALDSTDFCQNRKLAKKSIMNKLDKSHADRPNISVLSLPWIPDSTPSQQKISTSMVTGDFVCYCHRCELQARPKIDVDVSYFALGLERPTDKIN